ncbi:hypothetical protein PRZ48_000157 [Zasmidium cellare]|uniref:SnoaL-like domain-containing protein n=1 Tax=Zasmidium cellare TaxID=395010 RepID=A0ABR0EYZ2_ZASCE|nr:hypothetical protein PRZ48_000157 [Zasmidium cellare]
MVTNTPTPNLDDYEDSPWLDTTSLLPDPKSTPLEEYLCQMAIFTVHMHNDLRPSEILQLAPLFCSSDFRVEAGAPEDYMTATSRSEYFSKVELFRAKNPHYRARATNVTVHLDDERRKAVLIGTMDTWGLMGADDTLVRTRVYVGHWRRLRDGRWHVWKLEILQGPGCEVTS